MMAKNNKNKGNNAGAKNSGQVQVNQAETPKKKPITPVRQTHPDMVLVEITAATVINKKVVGSGKIAEVSQKEAERLLRLGKAKPYVDSKKTPENIPAAPPASNPASDEEDGDNDSDVTGDEDEGNTDEE